MTPPAQVPIGLALARASKVAGAAFDDEMTAAGGSLPVWLVLLSLKTGQSSSQRELADAVGIQGATLTHHLNGMESAGLVTRRRDPANRRVHIVELTDSGEEMFARLVTVAVTFDRRLRAGIDPGDLEVFTRVLGQLAGNATG